MKFRSHFHSHTSSVETVKTLKNIEVLSDASHSHLINDAYYWKKEQHEPVNGATAASAINGRILTGLQSHRNVSLPLLISNSVKSVRRETGNVN